MGVKAKILGCVVILSVALVLSGCSASQENKADQNTQNTNDQSVKTAEVTAPQPLSSGERRSGDNCYYKDFVQQTIKQYYPAGEIGSWYYEEWDIDGVKYAKTKFSVKEDGKMDEIHEILMRFSTDKSQIFFIHVDGERVLYDMDAEIAYMDSQPK